MHNDNYHNPHGSSNTIFIIISKWTSLVVQVAHIGEKRNKCIQNFGGKTCGKEAIWMCKHKWEYKIKKNLKESGEVLN